MELTQEICDAVNKACAGKIAMMLHNEYCLQIVTTDSEVSIEDFEDIPRVTENRPFLSRAEAGKWFVVSGPWHSDWEGWLGVSEWLEKTKSGEIPVLTDKWLSAGVHGRKIDANGKAIPLVECNNKDG